jgi:hypothetical protein
MQYSYIFVYSQNAWCILAIPIMLVFTFGALWARATNFAATATLLFIAPFVAVPFVFGNTQDNMLDLPLVAAPVHLFNFAFVLWGVAGLFMLVVSLLTRRPDAATVAPYVWRPSASRTAADGSMQHQPLHRRVGLWAAVAGVMYLAIYVMFW